MTRAELIADIQSVVQDGAWTSAKIAALLNAALMRIAIGQMIPGKHQITPPLPDLYTVDTVNTVTGSGSCDLPDDFNRGLTMVVDSGGNEIRIEPSFTKFLQRYGKVVSEGSVYVCSRSGKTLLYRDSPSTAETLTVHYYCDPTLMTTDSMSPDCIPDHLQWALLGGYTCMKIFEQIEDGIEGAKINTAYWTREFQQGLLELETAIGIDGSPEIYEDMTDRIG